MKRITINDLLKRSALLAVLVGFAAQASAHDLYWTEEEAIAASDIDGENVTVVFDGSGMNDIAIDLAVTDEHLYWTERDGNIWRAGRDGSDAAILFANDGTFSSLHYLALDLDNDRIFVTDYGAGVFEIDLTDDSVSEVWTGEDVSAFTGITLRNENELMWFTASNAWLYRTNLTTGETPAGDAIELEGGDANYDMAYDADADVLFYTNYSSGTLHAYDFGTGEHSFLRGGFTGLLGIDLSPSGTHLLLTERGVGITAYQIDNALIERLVPRNEAHFGVAATADPADIEPSPDDQYLFRTDFQGDTPGEAPRSVGEGGVWSTVSLPEAETDALRVVQDEDDLFGYGTDNHFLRVEDAVGGFVLNAPLTFHREVVTVSFNFIDREGTADLSQLIQMGQFMRDDGSGRAHILSFRDGEIRSGAGGYPFPDVRLRADGVFNNSAETITYDTPDGDTKELDPGLGDTWINGVLMAADYNFAAQDDTHPGPISDLNFTVFSNHSYSIDVDNYTVFDGARVHEPLVEGFEPPGPDDLPAIPYPEEPQLFLHEDFSGTDVGELTSIEDYGGPFTLSRLATDGSVYIVEDEHNWFGRGTDNRIMYWDEAVGIRFDIDGEMETGVATAAFDMYHEGEFHEDQNRLGGRFHTGSFSTGNPNHMAINFGFQVRDRDEGSYRVRGIGRDIHPFYVQRWAYITNNSRETITYESPQGERELDPGMTQVWLNGFPFDEPYSFSATDMREAIRFYRFDAFNRWSGYIDNIRVWEGAIVPDADIPPRDVEPEPRDLVVYEGFDYDEGSLLANDGGIGWAEGYEPFGSAGSAEVTSPGLAFGDLPVSGNKLTSAGGERNFRTIATDEIHSDLLNPYSDHIGRPGTSVWVSALIQAVDPVGNPFMGFGFYRDTDQQSGETIFIGKSTGDEENPFAFGEGGWRVQGAGGGSTTSEDASMFTGVPYTDLSFFVLRIDYRTDGDNRIYVFHNPDPTGGAPSTDEALGYIETPVGSFGFDRIRIAGNDNGFHLDELRIGTTWYAVTGQDAPEPPAGYEDWRTANFSAEDAEDDSVSGPQADPAGDGVANLIKYALGLDPHTPAAAGDLAVEEVREIDGERYLTLTFTRPDSIDDIAYTVQGSDDLAGWPDEAVRVDALTESHGDGTTTYVYRDGQPLGDAERRFLRLNVGFAD